jgi:flagellar biosynthesis protein FliR
MSVYIRYFVLFQVSVNFTGSNDFCASSNKSKIAELVSLYILLQYFSLGIFSLLVTLIVKSLAIICIVGHLNPLNLYDKVMNAK